MCIVKKCMALKIFWSPNMFILIPLFSEVEVLLCGFVMYGSLNSCVKDLTPNMLGTEASKEAV